MKINFLKITVFALIGLATFLILSTYDNQELVETEEISSQELDDKNQVNLIEEENNNEKPSSSRDQVIINYFLSQKDFAWQTAENSLNFCVIENLSPELELFPYYFWVRCGEFKRTDGSLSELSGVSVPVKLNYPNELSFYDISQFSHEKPGDGSIYQEDISRIFPPVVIEKIEVLDMYRLNRKLRSLALGNFFSPADWQKISEAISSCQVEGISQSHSLEVSADLKDGSRLWAQEPEIDDILELAQIAEVTCGKIMMSTE